MQKGTFYKGTVSFITKSIEVNEKAREFMGALIGSSIHATNRGDNNDVFDGKKFAFEI